MKKTVFYVLRLSLTLLIITALAAAGLGWVNGITKDAIAENQLAKTNMAMAEVLPGAVNISKIDDGIQHPSMRATPLYLPISYQKTAVPVNGGNAFFTPSFDLFRGGCTGYAYMLQ